MILLSKISSIVKYIQYMGFKWFIFRIKYELLKKISYFDRINQNIISTVGNVEDNLFTYKRIGLLKENFSSDKSFIKKADEALDGKIFSFSNEYFDYSEYGKINWHMNPITKIKADSSKSWNDLPDFGDYGDIKLIWEVSRFPQVYYFINAYASTKDMKYAAGCIEQILDWCESNPFPKGVNYKCGQEISFKIFAWIVALEYFTDFISKEEKKIIVKNIYTSLLRVNANIDYAAKSVKNNHSISEASGLLVGGLLFPQFKESEEFVKKGIEYLLQETSYQVYKDGSYIQNSFTYERLAMDILSFVFTVSQRVDFKLPKILKDRHTQMLIFLNSFMQKNGCLPNYGSNDGANLFPISSSNYRDFRVSLDFALGKSDFFNINEQSINLDKSIQFKDGGYYILKNKNVFSFIRCHSYRDRPAQNDMFHLDVWYKGKNIFCDTGSYSYNTDKKFKNNFVGVTGHNTVVINDTNQMQQVLNFGYSNWTKAKCIEFKDNLFIGENYAYEKKFGVIQKRKLNLNKNKLIINDDIFNIIDKTNIKQVWNTASKVKKIDKYSLQVDNCIISSNIEFKIERCFISDYYNSYYEGNKIVYEVNVENDFMIETVIEFMEDIV